MKGTADLTIGRVPHKATLTAVMQGAPQNGPDGVRRARMSQVVVLDNGSSFRGEGTLVLDANSARAQWSATLSGTGGALQGYGGVISFTGEVNLDQPHLMMHGGGQLCRGDAQ